MSGKTNNQILIQQMILEEFKEQSSFDSEGAYFEYAAASRYMASYNLDDDEILLGIVGGSRDGGCDAVYILCNELLVGEDVDVEKAIKRSSKIEIIVIQSKKTPSFAEDVFLKWKDVSSDLLTFDNDITDFKNKYSPRLLEAFSRIREVISHAARKGATTNMKYVYIANADQVADGVRIQQESLPSYVESIVNAGLFTCECELVGADKLMEMWFPPDEAELLIRFSCAYAPVPKRQDVFGLVALDDYYSFLTDDNGRLRGYLFEANIRDYEGKVEVNKAIRGTLESPQRQDFWWLNNGVTILASKAVQATGGEIRMEQPRIVNGLQTSYEIYNYLSEVTPPEKDNRNVMVKILVPEDDETRNKVIMATNSQTKVKKTSLRATDPIHLQIEMYMKSQNLFYERRKNFYKNQGKKPEEIVSISFLAQCLMSTILLQPDQARARPSTLLSEDKKYNQLFKKNGNLEAYLKAAQLGKKVNSRLTKVRPGLSRAQISDIRFYVVMGAAILLCQKVDISFGDLANMRVDSLTDEDIGIAIDESLVVYERLGGTSRVAKSAIMANEVAKGIFLHVANGQLESSGCPSA